MWFIATSSMVAPAASSVILITSSTCRVRAADMQHGAALAQRQHARDIDGVAGLRPGRLGRDRGGELRWVDRFERHKSHSLGDWPKLPQKSATVDTQPKNFSTL